MIVSFSDSVRIVKMDNHSPFALPRQLKSDYENELDNSESGWIILTIDIWGLPQHQRFFRDLNYEYGVYTLWNIPHQEIIKIEDL